MRWVRIPAVLSLILVALLLQQGYFSLARAGGDAEGEIFADVSRFAGVTHNRQGAIKAIGQAWGDYDNDGWLDLYVTDTDGPNRLYRNNGDGTFSDSPFADSVTLPDLESTGVTFADYDNDGWKDLYVVSRGVPQLRGPQLRRCFGACWSNRSTGCITALTPPSKERCSIIWTRLPP